MTKKRTEKSGDDSLLEIVSKTSEEKPVVFENIYAQGSVRPRTPISIVEVCFSLRIPYIVMDDGDAVIGSSGGGLGPRMCMGSAPGSVDPMTDDRARDLTEQFYAPKWHLVRIADITPAEYREHRTLSDDRKYNAIVSNGLLYHLKREKD